MNQAKLFSWVTVLSLTAAGSSLFAQETTPPTAENTADLTKFLNEKEREHLSGKLPIEELSAEEREHVQRMLRLRNLRNEEDVIEEPAGAEVPVQTASISSDDSDMLLDETEELRRENARLRAEVRRLQSHLSDLQYEIEDPRDPLYDPFQRRPRFYMPVR